MQREQFVHVHFRYYVPEWNVRFLSFGLRVYVLTKNIKKKKIIYDASTSDFINFQINTRAFQFTFKHYLTDNEMSEKFDFVQCGIQISKNL